MAHEYWWAGCGRSGCPLAAGHCGKLATSLIVIRRPPSVSIKIRKGDTSGGTCSSKYVCMRRRREEERVHVWVQPGPQDHSVAMVTCTIRAHEAKALDLRESDGVRLRNEMSYGESTCFSLCGVILNRPTGEEGEGHACSLCCPFLLMKVPLNLS